MKLIDIVEQDEWTKTSYDATGTIKQQLQDCRRQLAALKLYHERVWDMIKPYILNNIIISSWDLKYETLEASPYKGTYFQPGLFDKFNFVVDPLTPNIVKLWPRIEDLTKRTIKYRTQSQTLKKTEKMLAKKYYEQLRNGDDTGSSTTSIATPAQINQIRKDMKRINIGKRSMLNPLTFCNDCYVGPPTKYPDLTGIQFNSYVKIQKALKDAGLQPLSMLYGGRKNTGLERSINFVAVNNDQTVAWRKYDMGGGSGQNWIYLSNGTKCKTTSFIDDPNKFLVGAP